MAFLTNRLSVSALLRQQSGGPAIVRGSQPDLAARSRQRSRLTASEDARNTHIWYTGCGFWDARGTGRS